MRYYKLLLIFLFIFSFLFIAAAQKAPIKWGKVPKEDLAMTIYEPDPEAEAVVLCDYGKITFESAPGRGLIYRFSYHKRVKILKSSAADLGNISIDYYSYKNSEKLSSVKAQVFSPDGKKQSVSKKEMFNDEVNDYWSRKRFAIPNIQEGSVIEYRYELISDRIVTLQDWYFQDEIPIRHSELRVAIPEYLDYIYLFQSKNNLSQTNAKEDQSENNNIKNSSFIMKDMPALREETFVTTMNDYRARIKFQLREYKDGNGIINSFLSSWETLAKELIEEESFGKQYNKKNKHKDVLEAAAPYLAKANSPKEKIIAAQQFITDNVAWTGVYSKYTIKGTSLNKLLEKKEANKGGLNLMLVALLRSEGLNAWPMLSSKRSNGKMFPLYPILDQFTHTLAYVELEGETMILDVSDSFHPAGYLSINCLNGKGWVVDEENPRWVNIVAPKSAETYMATVTLTDKGMVSGNISGSVEGYAAIRKRQGLQEQKEGSWQEDLREVYPEAILDSLKIENEDLIYEPLRISMNCTIPGAAQVNGAFIYFSPILMESYQENPFKLEKRDYPVDRPYPFSDNYVLNLQIPEGYAIEELPESANMALPNKGGKFQFLVNAIAEDRIQIVNKVRIQQLYYSPKEYLAIKRFFDLIVEKQGEQIVLKKKS